MKIVKFFKIKLSIISFEALIIIVFAAILGSILFQKFKDEGIIGSKSPTTYARTEKDPTKYFDAVLISYDPSKKLAQFEVTKEGFTRRLEQVLGSEVKINKVTYDSRTLKVSAKENIKTSDLRSGESVRLFVSTANSEFNLKGLREIEVLDGR